MLGLLAIVIFLALALVGLLFSDAGLADVTWSTLDDNSRQVGTTLAIFGLWFYTFGFSKKARTYFAAPP